jgi:hypothetical protein
MEAIDGNGQPLDQSGVAYTWVIEGGGNKSGASVAHNFGKDGTYNVTMIARVDATGCECTKTKAVVMNRSNTTDLKNDAITIYPNPGTGKFQVSLTDDFGGKLQIAIMSLNGAKMKTFEYANRGTLDLDISDLADGVYIINLINENQQFSRRIEIRR